MTTLLRVAVAALATAIAAPAAAQTAPAAAANAGVRPSNPGPVIPGVCVLDEQRAIVASAAGRAYNTRMQALTTEVENELRPQRTTIESEANTLNGQLASLTPEVRQQRTQALQTRATNYENLARTRQAELAQTQSTQLRRIATAMQPVVAQVYVQRTCGLLVDKSAVVYNNPAMEITDAVITGLNAALPTLTFNRERAPAAPAQANRPAASSSATTPPTRR